MNRLIELIELKEKIELTITDFILEINTWMNKLKKVNIAIKEEKRGLINE